MYSSSEIRLFLFFSLLFVLKCIHIPSLPLNFVLQLHTILPLRHVSRFVSSFAFGVPNSTTFFFRIPDLCHSSFLLQIRILNIHVGIHLCFSPFLSMSLNSPHLLIFLQAIHVSLVLEAISYFLIFAWFSLIFLYDMISYRSCLPCLILVLYSFVIYVMCHDIVF